VAAGTDQASSSPARPGIWRKAGQVIRDLRGRSTCCNGCSGRWAGRADAGRTIISRNMRRKNPYAIGATSGDNALRRVDKRLAIAPSSRSYSIADWRLSLDRSVRAQGQSIRGFPPQAWFDAIHERLPSSVPMRSQRITRTHVERGTEEGLFRTGAGPSRGRAENSVP